MIDKNKTISLVEKLILNENSMLSDKFFLKEGKIIINHKGHTVILEGKIITYIPANSRNVKEKISLKNKEFKKLKKLFFEEKKRRDNELKLKEFNKLNNSLDKKICD